MSRWSDNAAWREVTSQWLKYPVGRGIQEECECVRGQICLFGSTVSSCYPDCPWNALRLLAQVPTFLHHFLSSLIFKNYYRQTLKIRPSYLSWVRKYRFPVSLANHHAQEESCLSGICNLLSRKANHNVKLIIFMCSRIYPLSLKENGLFYSLWLGAVVYHVDSLNFPVWSSLAWWKFPSLVFSFALRENFRAGCWLVASERRGLCCCPDSSVWVAITYTLFPCFGI